MKLPFVVVFCIVIVVDAVFGIATIQYNQYKYVGFRNTWHDGIAHEVYTQTYCFLIYYPKSFKRNSLNVFELR